MTEETQAPNADIDFTAFLAARREQDAAPVTVNVAGRVLTFTPYRTARPLLDIAVDGGDKTEILVSEFYRDSLSDDDYAYVQTLAADRNSGFDQNAYYGLFRQVSAKAAGRPTNGV